METSLFLVKFTLFPSTLPPFTPQFKWAIRESSSKIIRSGKIGPKPKKKIVPNLFFIYLFIIIFFCSNMQSWMISLGGKRITIVFWVFVNGMQSLEHSYNCGSFLIIFSIGGRILIQYQSWLFLENVVALIFTRNWLYGFKDNIEYIYRIFIVIKILTHFTVY